MSVKNFISQFFHALTNNGRSQSATVPVFLTGAILLESIFRKSEAANAARVRFPDCACVRKFVSFCLFSAARPFRFLFFITFLPYAGAGSVPDCETHSRA